MLTVDILSAGNARRGGIANVEGAKRYVGDTLMQLDAAAAGALLDIKYRGGTR
ncbi:hypothetical protein D3C72_2298300 [compost metagenome]